MHRKGKSERIVSVSLVIPWHSPSPFVFSPRISLHFPSRQLSSRASSYFTVSLHRPRLGSPSKREREIEKGREKCTKRDSHFLIPIFWFDHVPVFFACIWLFQFSSPLYIFFLFVLFCFCFVLFLDISLSSLSEIVFHFLSGYVFPFSSSDIRFRFLCSVIYLHFLFSIFFFCGNPLYSLLNFGCILDNSFIFFSS